MASSDVDQKYLGRIAALTTNQDGLVSGALYQILGLSVVLSRKLFRARKLRKLDTSRDTKSLQLYHHIIWLSREGLSILEEWVLPFTQAGQLGPECQVLTAKLRASFVHIFCLFHNNPPITAASVPGAVPTNPEYLGPPPPSAAEVAQLRQEAYESMPAQARETTPPKRHSRGMSLRDPIASITSDASFLTNPYAGLPPGASPPPTSHVAPNIPPGLAPVNVPQPSAFLLPSRNFIPEARGHFIAAQTAAAALLPGAHPLRLSTAIEYAAFLWDCAHDHDGARKLARQAIRQLREQEDDFVTDEVFEDAGHMVQILYRIMKRRSFETTPRTAQQEAADAQGTPGPSQSTASVTPRSTRTSGGTVVSPQRLPTGMSPRGHAQPSGAAILPAPPHPPRTSELPTPPRQSRRSTQSSARAPSIEGGPVGGISPSGPSGRSDRRSQTTQVSPSSRTQISPSSRTQVSPASTRHQPAQRTPQRPNTSSRREDPNKPQPPKQSLRYESTPPNPPPKDPGYTPSTRSGRGSGGQRVKFQQGGGTPEYTSPLRYPTSQRPGTSGFHDSGFSSGAEKDDGS